MIGLDKLKGGVVVLLLVAVLAAVDAHNNNVNSQNDQLTGASVLRQGVVSSIFGTKACSVNLANYPCQFVKDGKLDAMIVIGNKADAANVAATVSIALGLKRGGRISAPPVKLASEVIDPFTQNIISVGVGCSNSVTYRIQSRFGRISEKQCWNPALTKEGEGAITIYDFGNGKTGLVVEGYTGDDVKRAAKILLGYKDWQAVGLLKGEGVLVLPSSSGGIKISGPIGPIYQKPLLK